MTWMLSKPQIELKVSQIIVYSKELRILLWLMICNAITVLQRHSVYLKLI